VIPRTFPPAPGWSPDGHRIKSEVDYGRGPEKTWVYGALRVRDGHEVTMTAASRNSVFYQQFLQKVEAANPTGDIYVVTDNLSSHNSLSTRTWLEDHPRIRHVFIPVGDCWLNLQEGWWRIFRKAALAGQSFAGPAEIEHATRLATSQLNARASRQPAGPCRRHLLPHQHLTPASSRHGSDPTVLALPSTDRPMGEVRRLNSRGACVATPALDMAARPPRIGRV
jgi:hypothetical protein